MFSPLGEFCISSSKHFFGDSPEMTDMILQLRGLLSMGLGLSSWVSFSSEPWKLFPFLLLTHLFDTATKWTGGTKLH